MSSGGSELRILYDRNTALLAVPPAAITPTGGVVYYEVIVYRFESYCLTKIIIPDWDVFGVSKIRHGVPVCGKLIANVLLITCIRQEHNAPCPLL